MTKFTERWQRPGEVTEEGLYLLWPTGDRAESMDPLTVVVASVDPVSGLCMRRCGRYDDDVRFVSLSSVDGSYRLLGPFRGPDRT